MRFWGGAGSSWGCRAGHGGLSAGVWLGSGSGVEEALDGLIGARVIAGRPGENGQDGGDGDGVKIEGGFRRGQGHSWIDLVAQAEPVDQGLNNCADAIPVQWRAGLAAVVREN